MSNMDSGDELDWGLPPMEAIHASFVPGEELLAQLFEQLDNRRRGSVPCIAYKDDGTLCRQQATMLDRRRHGMVCQDHAPQPQVRVQQPASVQPVAPALASEVVLPDDTQPPLL